MHQTWFVGELGKDTGGVTREMWRLFGKYVQMTCDGQDGKLVFRQDSTKVQVTSCIMCHLLKTHHYTIQDGIYKRVGVLVGMSIVQGGSGYPFFAPSVYEYIAGKDVCSIYPDVEEIPDIDVNNCVVKVCLWLRNCIYNNNCFHYII